MWFPTILRYTGLLIFGYLLLLALSYSYSHPAYQAIVTLAAGLLISLGVKIIRMFHNKYGTTWVLWGILLFGSVVRFLWAIFVPTTPFSDFQYYHENAIKLSQGTFVLTKNMGYTLLLSASYRIYPNVLTGKLINAAASTLSILFLYLAGSRLINQQSGLIASFLFALSPSEILMVSVLGTEVIATMVGVITAFFIFRTANGKLNFSVTSMFWAGLFFGLGLTVRSSFIFYFPAILLSIFTVSPNYKQMSKVSLAFFAGIIIGLSLTLGSFFLSTKRFSVEPLRTQDSFPFLSGTNVTTLTTWSQWSQEDADLYFSWPRDQRDALARQEAINRIRSNPVGFILFIPKKIFVLMAVNDYGIIWSLHKIDWGRWTRLIGLLSQSVHVFILLFAFCAFKDVDLKNNPMPLIALILVLSILMPHTVLEVQGRYHHYIMPFIALLASSGLQQNRAFQ